MARYFFHLHEHGTVLEDLEGQECASLADAVHMATVNARDVMTGELRVGRLCLESHISIGKGGVHEVARVSFRDAVIVTGI